MSRSKTHAVQLCARTQPPRMVLHHRAAGMRLHATDYLYYYQQQHQHHMPPMDPYAMARPHYPHHARMLGGGGGPCLPRLLVCGSSSNATAAAATNSSSNSSRLLRMLGSSDDGCSCDAWYKNVDEYAFVECVLIICMVSLAIFFETRLFRSQ